MSTASLTIDHRRFEAALPAITKAARYTFRRHRLQDREEAIAEAQACAWKAWHGLVTRGKDPVAVGVSGIAGYAVRHALNGRRLGNRHCGRGARDVYHPRAQLASGFRLVSLDTEIDPGVSGDSWKEWLAEDNRCSPADEAAFRVDFEAWLAGLPERKRQVARWLAEGHETGLVARWLEVTPAAVSQTRTWLAESWRRFQSQAAAL
jgi:hypothetical protein